MVPRAGKQGAHLGTNSQGHRAGKQDRAQSWEALTQPHFIKIETEAHRGASTSHREVV